MKRQRPRMTYEFRKVSFSRDVPRSVGGVRTVWLRRKIMPLTLST